MQARRSTRILAERAPDLDRHPGDSVRSAALLSGQRLHRHMGKPHRRAMGLPLRATLAESDQEGWWPPRALPPWGRRL